MARTYACAILLIPGTEALVIVEPTMYKSGCGPHEVGLMSDKGTSQAKVKAFFNHLQDCMFEIYVILSTPALLTSKTSPGFSQSTIPIIVPSPRKARWQLCPMYYSEDFVLLSLYLLPSKPRHLLSFHSTHIPIRLAFCMEAR